MKYQDKKFISYQERQRYDDIQKSDRSVRRHHDQKNQKFYIKNLSRYIDKFWWNSLKEEDKEKVISLYTLQLSYLNESDEDCWYSDPVFDDWKDWIDYIKSTFNVDKGKLRMDKFKAIGI
jgi:hypothetical protein